METPLERLRHHLTSAIKRGEKQAIVAIPCNNQTARESAKQAIEHWIDISSVHATLAMIAEICSDKAEHIRENWQDEPLAKSWDKTATECLKAASKAQSVRV